MDNKAVGTIGENAGAELLMNNGYRILKRNYRCRAGEIDIIAQRGNGISFIEVKTRRNHNYGRPCESVTSAKQEHVRRTAYFYLKELEKHGYVPKKISYDVIEVTIEHIKSAF